MTRLWCTVCRRCCPRATRYTLSTWDRWYVKELAVSLRYTKTNYHCMNHKTLHEIAKFASGLVLGDFFFLWWLALHEGLPVDFLGFHMTYDAVLPGMAFDAVLFLALVHYGWRVGRVPRPKEQGYHMTVGIVFGLVALVHLWRLFVGAPFIIGEWMVPVWLSWIGVLVTAYLSYIGFHLALRTRK